MPFASINPTNPRTNPRHFYMHTTVHTFIKLAVKKLQILKVRKSMQNASGIVVRALKCIYTFLRQSSASSLVDYES